MAISLIGAFLVGLTGIALYEKAGVGDKEKIMIVMIVDLFNPWIGGVLLAAIFSAIMSTIDSQLLVSSSALSEDFYAKSINKDAPEKQVMLVGRVCVLVVSLIALLLSLNPESNILSIVAYAWGGFGAAFGPLILFACYSRTTTWQAALAGMVCGTVVLAIWKHAGWSEYMYEIVPGMIANIVTLLIVNRFTEPSPPVMKQFDQVRQSIKTS